MANRHYLPELYGGSYKRRDYDQLVDFSKYMMRSGQLYPPAYSIPNNLEGTTMNETTQHIDKGVLAAEIIVRPLANGSFMVNRSGYPYQAFSNVDDLLAYLKVEGKKYAVGLEAEEELKKAKAKKAN